VIVESRHLQLEVRDGVAAVVLVEHPERKHPLSFESYAELRDLFRGFADAPEVRAVVLTGSGEDFCSGGDVHDIIGPLVRMDLAGKLRFTRMTGDLVKAMRHCPQPIVAAVDGVCAGAGAILAMAADMRLATPRARVAFLFVRVGLSGADMGACAMLPRIVGQGRAAELLYTGRTLAAEEAERWGFFNRLVEPASLRAEAHELAASIAAGPARAHAVTKRMLHQEWNLPLDQAIDAEAEAQAICMETNDFRRAFEAFSATPRRKPEFQGD
jgi:enoyl-CoA hydratase/carnithine racemase